MVGVSSSSYKIHYVIVIKTFLNPKGHQNPICGSKVTAILLKGWILPVGGASAVKGLRSTGLPRLVSPCSPCHKSCVMCQISCDTCIFFYIVVKLGVGGSAVNGATQSSFPTYCCH